MNKIISIVLVSGVFLASECEARISGICRFDTNTLNFEGPAQEAAKCLLRPVKIRADLGPKLVELPPTLKSLIGNSVDLPNAKIRAYLANNGLSEAKIGGSLDQKLSLNSNGVSARFFVIHDTSSPNFINKPDFPADIDQSNRVNNLANYGGPNAVAHLFINRGGEVLAGHPLSQGWRATKLESQVVGTPARGLFIHVELIQPRRSNPSGGAGNDQIAPDPGFTEAQYQKLALAYVVASVRAGKWLLPGFHAVIDTGIGDGHDDPQNFNLLKFDTTLGKIIDTINGMMLGA
jgi:hypothetical protein